MCVCVRDRTVSVNVTKRATVKGTVSLGVCVSHVVIISINTTEKPVRSEKIIIP